MEPFVPLAALFALAATVPSALPVAQTDHVVNSLPEVLVEGHEPRYVAPTRRDKIGRIWAPVMIDGKGPFRLVLDTGATHSVVNNDVALALGIKPEDRGATLLRGVTGVATVPTIPVRSFEVGDLLIEPAVLPIIADAMGGADGILGNEGLRDKRIVIEFLRDRITITHSHGERATAGWVPVPLRFGMDGLLTVPAHVGTHRAIAVIDTGAQRTLGNLALRRILQEDRRRDGRLTQVYGASQAEQDGDSLAAPPIALGHATIDGARIIYSDFSIFQHWGLDDEPALIVGMDVLGLLDTLVIDYKRRELQVLTSVKAGAN